MNPEELLLERAKALNATFNMIDDYRQDWQESRHAMEELDLFEKLELMITFGISETSGIVTGSLKLAVPYLKFRRQWNLMNRFMKISSLSQASLYAEFYAKAGNTPVPADIVDSASE